MENKCYNCGSRTVWQNDFDFEDYGAEGEGIVTVWLCPNRGSTHEVYIPLGGDDDSDNK